MKTNSPAKRRIEQRSPSRPFNVDLAYLRQQFCWITVSFAAPWHAENDRLCRIRQLIGYIRLKVVECQKRCHLFDIRTASASGPARSANRTQEAPLRDHAPAVLKDSARNDRVSDLKGKRITFDQLTGKNHIPSSIN